MPFREFVEHGTFGTLDELDPPAWGPPEYDSHLVRTCHELRKKPLSQFTVEDLRIMIGQGLSLDHLIPRAIAILERDPLAEGDFYPGDLLKNVLVSPEPSYWQQHPEQAQRLRSLIEGVHPDEDDDDLLAALDAFRSSQS